MILAVQVMKNNQQTNTHNRADRHNESPENQINRRIEKHISMFTLDSIYEQNENKYHYKFWNYSLVIS